MFHKYGCLFLYSRGIQVLSSKYMPAKVCKFFPPVKCSLTHIYGTPQSKQSKAPGKWRIFFWDTPSKNAFLCNFFYIFLLIMMCKLQKKYSFHFYAPSRVRTAHPKLGVFFKIVKIQLFDCFIAQLVKKLQQWSLYEVIEDILPFVLNTKRPLSDIWLVSYKQNSFGCFLKKWKFWIFFKTPKTVLLISQQPNNAQKPFCIQNERQDILYHLI